MSWWSIIDDLQHKLPLAAGAVALLAVWRHLRPQSLADAPRRQGVLEAWDLLVGFGVYLLGVLLFGLLLERWGPADPQKMTVREMARLGLLGQAVGQGPVALFFIWRAATSKHGWRRSGLLTAWPVRDVALGLKALAAAAALVMSVGMIVTFIGTLLGAPTPESGHAMLSAMRDAESPVTLAMLLVSAVMVAPILEEIMFRGLVQTSLLELFGRGRRWAIVFAAAFLFTIVHGSVPWQMLPALFVLGLVLGWLYERTGSLWPCFVVHVGFNAFNSAMWLLMNA